MRVTVDPQIVVVFDVSFQKVLYLIFFFFFFFFFGGWKSFSLNSFS